MSLVDSGVVLQALSSFTGATVKSFSHDTPGGDHLNVHNFLSTVFNKPTHVPDSAWLENSLFVSIGNFLDPQYDYDFTDLSDDDSDCMRGDEQYKRPRGWKRIAVKVLDKYPDGNAWLGTGGWRSESVAGEWPVSYHGTNMNSAEAIVGSHYKPGSGQVYGRGIYSTYDIEEATAYSHEVKCPKTGKSYMVLLQNRINPKMRKVCKDREEYWLIEVPAGTSPHKEKEIYIYIYI